MPISRRQLLKTLGAATGAAVLTGFSVDTEDIHLPILTEENPLYQQPAKPIRIVTIGAGNRGNVYGNYASKFPDEMDVVGLAEPIALRNERYAQKHNIEAANRFVTWEHVFERPKFADAVLITTPDHLHYGPCMAALKAGYDVLLEKMQSVMIGEAL